MLDLIRVESEIEAIVDLLQRDPGVEHFLHDIGDLAEILIESATGFALELH